MSFILHIAIHQKMYRTLMQYSLPCSPFVKYRCRQLHINSSGMQKRMEIEPSETFLTELVLPYDCILRNKKICSLLDLPMHTYAQTISPSRRSATCKSRPAGTIESYSNTIDSSQTWSYLASPVVPYIPFIPHSSRAEYNLTYYLILCIQFCKVCCRISFVLFIS